jgi:hypothetical protein
MRVKRCSHDDSHDQSGIDVDQLVQTIEGDFDVRPSW